MSFVKYYQHADDISIVSPPASTTLRSMSGLSDREFPLGYQLAQLERAFITNLDKGLAQFGLTSSRFGVLLFLNSEPGLTSAELARRAIVTPQTMIRIVAALEKLGFVERRSDINDGRVLAVRLTTLGRNRLKAANNWVEHVETELIKGESDTSLRTVADFIRRAQGRMDVMEA